MHDSSHSSGARCGFLFATFKGEQTPLTEQVYFALSQDGRDWEVLNQGEPVLVSSLGELGARDPFILRSRDGNGFFLVATDLSIHRNPDWKRAVEQGSRSILIWESEDLVHWSEPRLVALAPEDAGCAWAPEVVYDEDSQDYLVFWASTTGRDQFAKHRIWAARTKDFQSFGQTFLYIEKPYTIIDTTIFHHEGAYYRFTKDEKEKTITMERSPMVMGPWQDVPGFSLSTLHGYEGPQCYRLDSNSDGAPATWCLILDQFSVGAGYQPFLTDDLASGNFRPANGFNFPFRFRHGSVLPITAPEYQRLKSAF